MKNIMHLVRINLIMLFRGEAGFKGKKIRKTLLYGLLFLCFVPMLIGLGIGAGNLYRLMEGIGQGQAFFALVFTGAGMVVFLFGIFFVISTYYISRDIPTYLHMPLEPFQIIVSRFVSVLLYEYMTLGLFLAPVIIGAGIGGGFGIGYYLVSALVFLVLPILPLSTASVLVILIMSFSRRSINKDRFSLVSGIIALAVSLAVSFGTQGFFMSLEDPEALQKMIFSGDINLAERIASFFPGILQASRAVAGADAFQFLLFAAIGLCSFGVFILVAQKLYFKGVLGMIQQGARRKAAARGTKSYEMKDRTWSYTLKELRILFRTPIYFMNLAIMDFLIPVFLVVPLFMGGEDNPMGQLQDIINPGGNLPMVLGFSVALFLFVSAMNGITATCISREGRQVYFMKYIPMAYREQVNAKILSGMVISMAAVVLVTLVAGLLFSLGILTMALVLLCGFNAVLFTRLTGVFVDAMNPKLNWDSEQKAVKQNMNLVVNMMIGIAIAALVVLAVIRLPMAIPVAILVYIPGFFVVNAGIYAILMKNMPRMLGKIE
ncbi:MAG: hypothetical protein R6W96_05765 [Clostridia bacterium]